MMERSEFVMYLLQVITIHGVFFMLYHFLLRSKTTYLMNRVYLLSTLIMSFVIPFIEMSVSADSVPVAIDEAYTFNWETNHSQNTADMVASDQIAAIPAKKIDYWQIAKWAYVFLALGLVLRSLFHLLILQKLKKDSLYVEKKWFKLFKTVQVHPFSFLANVFIPSRLFGTDSFDQILEHECEHVRQRHSIDRLLVDFIAALFWFNPFMYLYRRALIEIHEYQADAAVIKKFPDPIGYQEVLFSQLKATPYSGLVSHFNFSTIKKRIVMINKQKNRKSIWAYLLAAPVTFLVILAFANKTVDQPSTSLDAKEKIEETTAFEKTEEVESPAVLSKTEIISTPTEVESPIQTDYKPSILPLKETARMKVTSGFGMRVDPIDKKRKMHKGLDLGTPIGTTVIATDDGIVHQASYHDKYGYFVLIEHGDKFMTRYSQLSELKVKKGDNVSKAQVIALSGNSGRSTGPHLHYEVIEVGVGHQNPIKYINNHQFTAAKSVINISESEKQERTILKLRLAEEEAKARKEEAQHDQMLESEERAAEIEIRQQVAELVAVAAHQERELAEMQMIAVEKERELAEVRAMEEIRKEEQDFLDIKHITENPLFILDGEVVDKKETRELVPEEIEHVEVLKGEGAIRKYGSKAEGGVVIIETKKEKRSKPKPKNKEKPDKKSNQGGLSATGSSREFSNKDRGNEPFVVVIDPGHGGKDLGIVSASGNQEKEISLAIAKRISANFQGDQSIQIVLTRDDDTFMHPKDRLTKSQKADMLICLHTDTTERKSSIVPIYSSKNLNRDESKRAANLLESEFADLGKAAKVGYSDDNYILNNSDCPSVLLSFGFAESGRNNYLVSNSGQGEVALAISRSIEELASL